MNTLNNNEDLYLTKDRKEYYMKDFQRVLNYKEIDFWDIDEGVANILIQINNNPNLQTLYSKKIEAKSDSFGVTRSSYLQVCYIKSLKEKLLDALIEIKNTFKNEIEIEEEIPSNQNPNKRSSKIFGIGCIDDENYFNIHAYTIRLESYSMQSHNLFWEMLQEKLSHLK